MHRWDPNEFYDSRSECDLRLMPMKGFFAFSKALRMFLVSYPEKSLGCDLNPSSRNSVGVSYSLSRPGRLFLVTDFQFFKVW